jgi:hypothetical protein
MKLIGEIVFKTTFTSQDRYTNYLYIESWKCISKFLIK